MTRSLRRDVVRTALAAGALTAALGLAGCITLFPKTTPALLYRFDAKLPATPRPEAPSVAVRTAALDFDPAAAGDQIMTVDGDEVAYVAGARWSAPAGELFAEAINHGFDAAGGNLRLVGSGQPGSARFRLKLAVTRFEARYDNGPKAAPTVVIRLHADLGREDDSTEIGSKDFDASVAATDNRVGPIVEAYDEAATKVVGDLVAWVRQPD